MDQEQINDLLARNPSPEAEIQYQSREFVNLDYVLKIEAENKELKRLLKEALDLYFDYSNKDNFDEWVLKTERALKGVEKSCK